VPVGQVKRKAAIEMLEAREFHLICSNILSGIFDQELSSSITTNNPINVIVKINVDTIQRHSAKNKSTFFIIQVVDGCES
jgi:hypothetical protein